MNFTDTVMKNFKQTFKKKKKGVCHFTCKDGDITETDIITSYEITLTAVFPDRHEEEIVLTDSTHFTIDNNVAYFKVHATPTSLISRLFPYSHRPKIHEILTHISIDNHTLYYRNNENNLYIPIKGGSLRSRAHSV
jgi:hypothetical protein